VGGLRSPHLQYSLIHSVVILGRGSSQISDLHLQSPISNVVILGRIRSPISNLQSPISNLDSGARGRRGAQTFKEMQFGFIHTDHLSSPISNLLLGHCRRRQQSTTSIFNLRSHIWGGWLGARIYNLHSPSPISTFWPCCCSERSAIHNLNLRSLVLNGEPDRTDLLARLGRVRVRDPLGSPVLIYILYPNDLLVLRRDFHYSF
jgi:hypothetical protein